MEKKQLYYISDTIQSLIDWDSIYKMPRYAGGHDEQMKGLFLGATVIAHWNEGSYQGTVATCVKLPDGRYLLYNDYYGSCSGCDAWEDATDEEVKKMCIDLANGAYIFNSLQDVITFLSQDTFDAFEWETCAKPLLSLVNLYCFMCSLRRCGFAKEEGDEMTKLSLPWFGFKVDVYAFTKGEEPVKAVVFDFNARRAFDKQKCGIRTMFEILDCLHGVKDNEIIDKLNLSVFTPTFNKLNNLLVKGMKDMSLMAIKDKVE